MSTPREEHGTDDPLHERLGLSDLEDPLPRDFFEELLERIDRRELGADLLGMLVFGLLEATSLFTEMLIALGLAAQPEEEADD